MTLVDQWTDAQAAALRCLLDDDNACVDAGLLERLRSLITADQVVLFELDTRQQELISMMASANVELPSDPSFLGAFWDAFFTCAPCAHPHESGDYESITTLSDFYSSDELRGTQMYQLFQGIVHADYAMTALLASAVGTDARLMFFRQERDFNERERMLLALLRPHLNRLYRRATERRGGLDRLTQRQRAVLHLVARGYSNDEIAKHLVVSPGTVRKHLDNIFRQLGVSGRAAAVARAFPDGVPPLPLLPVTVPRQRVRSSS